MFEDEVSQGSHSNNELYLEIKNKAVVMGLTRLHKIHQNHMTRNFETVKTFENLKDFLLHAIYFFSELMNKNMIKRRVHLAFEAIKHKSFDINARRILQRNPQNSRDGFD